MTRGIRGASSTNFRSTCVHSAVAAAGSVACLALAAAMRGSTPDRSQNSELLRLLSVESFGMNESHEKEPTSSEADGSHDVYQYPDAWARFRESVTYR